MSDVIRTRREGGVIEVTLDRPKANAIDLATSRIMGETGCLCSVHWRLDY